MSQEIVYDGQIIRVQKEIKPDGRIFEKALRSPGTRIIIHDSKTDRILLSREFRQEINDFDYRLPGGKVRDKYTDWEQIKSDPTLNQHIIEAGKKEALQESGIVINNCSIFTVSASGGPTIDWTLYYLTTTDYSELDHQDLEVGEDIAKVWTNIKDIIDICLSGKMKEGRSAAALLQYLHSIGKI
jgi:ADP-ribose pyrophosphatase